MTGQPSHLSRISSRRRLDPLSHPLLSRTSQVVARERTLSRTMTSAGRFSNISSSCCLDSILRKAFSGSTSTSSRHSGTGRTLAKMS